MDARCSSGKIYFIRELHPKVLLKESENIIRTTGRIVSHEFSTCQLVIEDPTMKSKQLTIDTGFIEPFHSAGGALFQFLGELLQQGEDLVLKAFVSRCVDGLDVRLYERAIEYERDYLTTRKNVY